MQVKHVLEILAFVLLNVATFLIILALAFVLASFSNRVTNVCTYFANFISCFANVSL